MESQEFNGKLYYKYRGARYFTKANKSMHRIVWEHYNGLIPKNMHIHHIDFNEDNNDISNLQILTIKAHSKIHSEAATEETKELRRINLEKQRPLTKAWHSSKEGMAWHKEHAKNFDFGHKTYGKYNCDVCDCEFTKMNISQRFCSNKCKSQYRRDNHIDDKIRKCVKCGTEFIVNKYSPRKYCSKSCY